MCCSCFSTFLLCDVKGAWPVTGVLLTALPKHWIYFLHLQKKYMVEFKMDIESYFYNENQNNDNIIRTKLEKVCHFNFNFQNLNPFHPHHHLAILSSLTFLCAFLVFFYKNKELFWGLPAWRGIVFNFSKKLQIQMTCNSL